MDPLSLAVGFAAGALVFGLLWARAAQKAAAFEARLETERAALGDHFARLAQTALQSNNEHFLTLAGERLRAANERGASDLDKRTVEIEKLVKPIEKELLRINSLAEQLQGTDKAIREDLLSLKHETSKLSGVLRNPSAQGKWGEFVLETILEKANLIKGVHYDTQEQIEGGRRPDVIINLHDGFRIAIDSKAPINEFVARLDDDISNEEAKAIQASMGRAVRAHVKALGAKAYQDNIDGADFVILFLPSEAVFSATLRSDPDIVDYAAESHVVIASPTLIISLLRVIGLSWRQVEMAKNAAEISALGATLHARFSTFLGHFAKVGRGLGGALAAYNDAVGSAERSVLPPMRKFTKLHSINQAHNLPELGAIENTPRSLLANEGTQDDDDDINTENDGKASHG
ncbi:MAG: DNA recombination protein RmuC [Micavibrio sp.]